jgi:PIN domain-containing protein
MKGQAIRCDYRTNPRSAFFPTLGFDCIRSLNPRGFETYREAARIFRAGRAKGFALTTIDSLIVAIALEHGGSLFTLDEGFSRIACITRLSLYSF